GLTLGPCALDDLLLFVHADDQVTHDLVDDLQPAIELLHEVAGADNDVQHVHTFFEAPNLVGEASPAPVLGLVDSTAHPCDSRLALLMQVGRLLLSGFGWEDIYELVLSIGHLHTPCGLGPPRDVRERDQAARRAARIRRYSVVAGSPPLKPFITASIPD